MKAILRAAMFTAVLALSASSYADVYFCNNTDRPIWFLWGQIGTNPDYCSGDWEDYGWYRPNAYSCTQVFKGCYIPWWASAPGPTLVYYAEDDYGNYWGSSDWSYCMPNAGFDPICQSDAMWSNFFGCFNGTVVAPDYFYFGTSCDVTFTFNM